MFCIPPKNVLQKVLKMVFFAQKTPLFGPKNRLRIWGVPPSPPLRTKFSAKRELRIWRVPPHYGLTGRIIKNLKMPKKLRQGAQNSGKITSNLKLIKFSAIH